MKRYQDYESLVKGQPLAVRKAVHMLHEEVNEVDRKLKELVAFYVAMHDSINSVIGYLEESRLKAPGKRTDLSGAIDRAVGELRTGVSVDSLAVNDDEDKG